MLQNLFAGGTLGGHYSGTYLAQPYPVAPAVTFENELPVAG